MDASDGRSYALLRHLTLPVAAITTSAGGVANGFIVNSAQRASLVPSAPRISLYVSKPNFSHDLVYSSGVFGVHLLRNDQWDVIRALGLRSARDFPEKLHDLTTRRGVSGCPMLTDCVAAFECRVINAMDAGGATFFLGDVVEIVEGKSGDVLTSGYFRQNAPADVREKYDAGLSKAQEILEPMSRTITVRPWPGPTTRP